MSEVNPVAEAGFGSSAATYERGRPTYPADAVARLVEELGIRPGTTVLDLAAGTGKLTRLLVPTGARVVAVEPLEAMRAELVHQLAAVPGVEVRDGTAEAIPLEDGSVDAVTVAQAFHWFRPAEALDEMARVLRPGGGLGLVWNERDESVPWVAELSRLINWGRRKPYDPETEWDRLVARSGRFTPLEQAATTHEQVLDADGVVARVLSTSYVAASPAEEQAELAERVRALVADFPPTFPLPYLTTVLWCRKA